jgi:hypothetical protein
MLQLFQSRFPKQQNLKKTLQCIFKGSEQTKFEQLINEAATYVFSDVCP